MTLVEMLIAVALTLLIMTAIVRVFEMMGTGVRRGKATIEMANQLRNTTFLLQRDLDQVSVPLQPWVDPDQGLGYFEIIEGAGNDRDPEFDGIVNADQNSDGIDEQDASLGDIDDILMFTVRSSDKPFTGRIWGAQQLDPSGSGQLLTVPATPGSANSKQLVIESNTAEVIWWVQFEDLNGNGIRDTLESASLHRRVLLVRPDLNGQTGFLPGYSSMRPDQLLSFFNNNDISVRVAPNGQLVANTLGDLSRRENRFLHENDGLNYQNSGRSFPHFLHRRLLTLLVDPSEPSYVNFAGEDIMLSDVLAFDVRVYDPRAPIRANMAFGTIQPGVPMTPGDTRFSNSVSTFTHGLGAFVDLFYSRDLVAGDPVLESPTLFSDRPHHNLPSQKASMFLNPPSARDLGYAAPFATYDTWPSHYERDGINQDQDSDPITGSPLIDEGVNGIDDANENGVFRYGVDDEEERETAPPYPYPLRGVEVTIRKLEFGTRQVRQVSVVGEFLSE